MKYLKFGRFRCTLLRDKSTKQKRDQKHNHNFQIQHLFPACKDRGIRGFRHLIVLKLSVFESRRISFLKIFLVLTELNKQRKCVALFKYATFGQRGNDCLRYVLNFRTSPAIMHPRTTILAALRENLSSGFPTK